MTYLEPQCLCTICEYYRQNNGGPAYCTSELVIERAKRQVTPMLDSIAAQEYNHGVLLGTGNTWRSFCLNDCRAPKVSHAQSRRISRRPKW